MVSLAGPPAAGTMRPPLTPASKRPTTGLKRDSSFLETDDDMASQSTQHTAKRLKVALDTPTPRKVAFDPKVDVRIMDPAGWSEKSFELVKEEVRLGVERHLLPGDKGMDDAQYTRLVQALKGDVFDRDAPTGSLLRKYVMALEGRVSSLGECGKLVIAALDLAWVGRDESFVAQYLRFLVALASAHAKYISTIMEKLVAHFAKLPASLGRLPDEEVVLRATMFARVHWAVKTLLRQIPSASGVITRTLKLGYPNDLATTRSYIQYQKQMMRVAEYAPELKAEIMALMVQRLVAVDVQIQQDIEELEEESEEKLLQRPSSKDGDVEEDSDDSDADSVSSSEETSTEEDRHLKELRLKVSKMDGTLDLMFEYYTPAVQDGSKPEFNDAFQQLMTHFIAYILPNRTRHAQFLLFHLAQTSNAHVTFFVSRCVELAFDHGSSQHRITAIAYIASFVARGSHISGESVRDVVGVLGDYLEEMRARYEPACRGPDRRTYAIYYAVSQALLYIFCFRWRDLVIGSATPELDGEGDEIDSDDILAESRDLAWMPGLKEVFNRNLFCRINPLKVCSPAIVSEFASIARHVRLVEVLSLLESNKRLRLGQNFTYYGSTTGGIDIGRRETAWDRKTGEAHHQLEAYFPFDPYHLPKSKKWVDGDYNEWKLPRGMRVEDEDGYSDEDSEDESDEESLGEEYDEDELVETGSTSS